MPVSANCEEFVSELVIRRGAGPAAAPLGVRQAGAVSVPTRVRYSSE